MLARSFVSTTRPSPGESATSLGISILFHGSLLALLAFVILPPSSPGHDAVGGGFLNTEVDSPHLPDSQFDASLTSIESVQKDSVAEASRSLPTTSHAAPMMTQTSRVQFTSLGISLEGLTDKVSVVRGGPGSGDGIGMAGNGGNGFFGLDPQGESIVFVVDASQSMNFPYPGEAHTRFGRVKLELLATIAAMSEEQRFFIVFFNLGAIPMPAQRMVEATPEAQKKYLDWMARVPAHASTNPGPALLLALQLQPDVIYFLTDGNFDYEVVPGVTGANRRHVIIHTIGFGDDRGEAFLKKIAEKNGGTYKFIPQEGPPPQ